MNRRKFMAVAGAIITAEGLWIPGQKLISIPKPIIERISITYPKILWPGIERWYYDNYKERIVAQKIKAEDFYIS